MQPACDTGDAKGVPVVAAVSRPVAVRVLASFVLVVLAGALVAERVRADVPPEAGFNVHPFTQRSVRADVVREFRLIRRAGGDVARLDVPWSFLEPERDGRFHQGSVRRLDVIVRTARKSRIKLMMMVSGTPCWASSAPRFLGSCRKDFARYPPRRAKEYGEIVGWLSGRYGRRLAGIEVWNEVNGSAGLKTRQPARQYTRMVRAAHRARRKRVPVIAGALASDGKLQFMRRLYRLGIRGHYDIWSTHTYGGRPDDVVAQLEVEQAVRRGHGDRTPVWVDEFGWPTCVRRFLGGDCAAPTSLRDQAIRLSTTFDALGDVPYVEAALAYELRDSGTNPANRQDNFGVVRRDFTRKPAFGAVKGCLLKRTSCG